MQNVRKILNLPATSRNSKCEFLSEAHVCFSTAPATTCMVCSLFRKGKCKAGKGNCTVEEGPGCRTRDIFYFNIRGNDIESGSTGLSRCLPLDTVRKYERPSLPDGFRYNHTQLDCSNECKSWKLIRGDLKVSSFCCKDQDFCNKYRGKSLYWKPR
ncbi:hypothetical protein GH733_019699 [Mirounga leonina]|nr:hypothetical protein GH733_019703 [Mirounga leonina]KAF3812321.1 hypothetical protein GH733_019699 [Mirounga leonina]